MDKSQREDQETELKTRHAINQQLVLETRKCWSAMEHLKTAGEQATTEYEKLVAEMQRLEGQTKVNTDRILQIQQVTEVSAVRDVFLTFYQFVF